MKQRFYRCRHCSNIIAFVKTSGSLVRCCGDNMVEVVPCIIDASLEKHIPVYSVEGNTVHVKVGVMAHPMLPAHNIEWISLQTKQGNQRKILTPNDKPDICFEICEGDEIEAVYAYCNIHGLWKS